MKDTSWIKPELEKLFCGCPSLADINSFIENKISRFNGKLYRYYSFVEDDKNCALSNLKDGIIYFQEPTKFNDPFDCALGFSVDLVLKSLIPRLVNENINLEGENQELIKSAIISILGGENELPNTENQIVSVAKELFSLPRMSSILKRAQNGEEIDDAELTAILLEEYMNGNLTPDLIKKLLNPKLNLQSLPQDMNFKSAIASLFKTSNISTLLNSQLNSEQMSFINSIQNVLQKDSITEKIELLCNMTGNRGDELKKEIDEINKLLETIVPDIKKTLNEHFAIACFSESPNNVLMWSHYAYKHTGFCVEYDFTKLKDKNKLLLLYPAIYTDERPAVPLSLFDMSNLNDIKTSLSKESLADISYTLLCKSQYWSYENEWRIICTKNQLQEQKLFEDLVTKVYLGVNISDIDKGKILETIKEKNNQIEIVQYKLDNAKFELIVK